MELGKPVACLDNFGKLGNVVGGEDFCEEAQNFAFLIQLLISGQSDQREVENRGVARVEPHSGVKELECGMTEGKLCRKHQLGYLLHVSIEQLLTNAEEKRQGSE